jgi:uncharacterized membrane protein
LICHLAATSGYSGLALVWLGLLPIAAAAAAGALGWRPAVVGLACLALAGFGGAALDDAVLRIPPIAIPLGLALVFGQTLLPGRTPLVNRIGEHVRGPLPTRVADYGRALTRLWTWIFLALALEALLLALFANAFWWSAFTNFINYAIIASVFVGEYAVRRRVLTDEEHSGFFDYVRDLLHSGQRLHG